MMRLLLSSALALTTCACDADVPPPAAAADASTAAAGEEEESCCSEEEPVGTPLSSASIYHLSSSWQDHHGEPRQLADFRGKPVLIAMIFTHCRYACPRIVADVQAIRAGLTRSQRQSVQVVLASMDSDRDTPEVLAEFARTHELDEAWATLLHGDADAVRELGAVLGVNYQRAPSGDFSHSNIITVLDGDGAVAYRQQGLGTDPAKAIAAVAAHAH